MIRRAKSFKIVFDVDEVLNNLVYYALERCGIKHKFNSDFKKYRLNKNEIFTEEEVNNIVNVFKDEKSYNDCEPADGIERITTLALQHDVTIHTLCMNKKCAQEKKRFIFNKIRINEDNIVCDLDTKTPIEDADIVVEDNLEYLITTSATHKILIDKPYNKSENYGFTDEQVNIIRVENLNEAITYIECLSF